MSEIMQQTIRIVPDVLSQEVSGETVFLNLSSECYYSLDTVGTRIWHLLQEFGDLQSVNEVMLEEYDVEEEQMEKDLAELLAELVNVGILEVV